MLPIYKLISCAHHPFYTQIINTLSYSTLLLPTWHPPKPSLSPSSSRHPPFSLSSSSLSASPLPMQQGLTSQTDAPTLCGPRQCPAAAGNLARASPGPLTSLPEPKGPAFGSRTGCNFDGSGRGHCQTGDCGGLLRCQAYGTPPNTLAEYALNQFNNLDFFDISLVDGFNVPMDFSPTSNGCSRGIRCTADINGQCPNQLKTQGGCNNPCTVSKTNEYCCTSGSCTATDLSRFFKRNCPDAYSYPKDDQTSTFTCKGGTNYRVVFCP